MSLHIVLLILTVCVGIHGRAFNSGNKDKGPDELKPAPVSYPFVASIQMLENGRYSHLCGATIIHELFLLTAAHCFVKHKNMNSRLLFVEAGSDQLFSSTGQRLRINAFKKHPDFYPFSGHDIALVELASPLPIDNIRFKALDFHNSTRKVDNVDVELIGWGRTIPSKAKTIETVRFRTITDETCFVNFQFKYLTNSEICAVNTAGPRGACDGDSGGPLVEQKSLTLYGLLSYGRNPCEVGKPFAFTRTSIYANWIDKEIINMLKLNRS